MAEEEKELLPLEKLRLQYIPISEFPEKYGISVSKVMSLMNSKRIHRAELKVEGERKRVLHADYVEVLKAIEEERRWN